MRFKSTIREFFSPIISAVILISITIPSVSLANTNSITDINATNSNYGIYVDLVNNNALTTDNEGRFRPSEPVNKAAFFKASMTYLGFTPIKGANHYTGYSDIPEDSWFSPYIRKALEIRAITNVLNEEFHPEAYLTRQEALVLTMRIYGIPTPLSSPESNDLFTDIRTNHPIAPVYAAAKAHNIFIDAQREDFRPNLTLTRGDAAILLYRAKLAAFALSDIQPTEGYGSISVVPVVTEQFSPEEEELLENEKFGLMLDAWGRIQTSFLYEERISNEQLIYGAIDGMVDSLDDPYSTFHKPEEDGQAFVFIPEGYEGIGAVIEEIDGEFLVVTTINNSPAYRSGLKSKDVILEIEGQSVSNYTIEEVLNKIKGQAGTLLKMKVKRDSTILTFEIIREEITIESITRKTVGNGINLLRIDQFTETSGEEFQSHLDDIIASGSNKLIIDVRNNPGGYLTSTKEILNNFLTSNQIVFLTVDREGFRTKYYSDGQGQLRDWDTVVLVNEGSASASEIFAGAVQDYGVAEIIGTKTFGKGSVQDITEYNDSSTLKLTVGKWLTSFGRDIDHIGLVPDQVITINDVQRQAGQDPQLDAAIRHFN